ATLFAGSSTAAAGLVSVKAAALTEGVLRAMLVVKLKIAATVLLAGGVAGAALGTLGHPAQAGLLPTDDKAAATKPADPPKPKTNAENIGSTLSHQCKWILAR